MNLWLLLISYGVFQGIFLILYFCFSKKVNGLKRILLILLLTSLTILLADYVFSNYYILNRKNAFVGIGWSGPFWLLIAPLYYLLFHSFLTDKLAFNTKNWLHFIPFFISFIFSIPFFILPADSRQDYLLSYSAGHEITAFHIISKVAYHIQLLLYPILIFGMMKRKKMGDINFIFITSLGLLFIGIASFIHLISFNLFGLAISWFTSTFVFISLTLFVHTTAFLLMIRPDWIAKSIKEVISRYTNTNLANIDIQKLRNELNMLMNHHKIYLKQNLGLSDLSNKLLVTPHQLSEFLNQENEQSFNDYINIYRVKEAQELLKNLVLNNITVEAVAYEVVFSSPTTFYRNFKKQTGYTPKKWLEQQ